MKPMMMYALDVGIVGIIFALISQKARQLMFYGIRNISSLFIRRTYLKRSLGDALITYMYRKGYKTRQLSGALLGEDPVFIKSEREVKHILYKHFESNSQAFYGKKLWPIVISGRPMIQDQRLVKQYDFIVYSFRWATDIMKILDLATEEKNENLDNDGEDVNRFVIKRVSGGKFMQEKAKAERSANGDIADRNVEMALADPFSAYFPIKWDKDNIGQTIQYKTMEMMSLSPELEDVRKEIKFWHDAQEWYEEREIKWSRGIGLFGPPGLGKTLFARAIAEELNMPLIVFDLGSMNNVEFMDAWKQILPKRVVLFEDIDSVFHGRENIAGGDLSFDALLNVLDGVEKKQGILTLITTNHPKTLDPALLRPGRIDRVVNFSPLDHKGRYKLAIRILKDHDLAEKAIATNVNENAAQLQERCCSMALDILWGRKEKTVGPQNMEEVVK